MNELKQILNQKLLIVSSRINEAADNGDVLDADYREMATIEWILTVIDKIENKEWS